MKPVFGKSPHPRFSFVPMATGAIGSGRSTGGCYRRLSSRANASRAPIECGNFVGVRAITDQVAGLSRPVASPSSGGQSRRSVQLAHTFGASAENDSRAMTFIDRLRRQRVPELAKAQARSDQGPKSGPPHIR